MTDLPITKPTILGVAKHFSKAYDSYNQHATAQYVICQHLITKILPYLPSRQLDTVLEIGCGTGNLSKLLFENLRIDSIFLNDLYDKITKNLPNPHGKTHHIIGDVLAVALPHHLNLVTASSSLQWIDDVAQLYQKIHTHMASGGILAFSDFLPNNLHEIKSLTGRGLDYRSTDEQISLLNQAGFKLLHTSTSTQTLYFNDPMAVLHHLKLTGTTATNSGFIWNKTNLHAFKTAYQERFGVHTADGTWQYPLSYHASYFIAQK
ncbi:methyltransferase domain-containing protein [Moraxella nasovis]|uniref:methyltransferase domain-containing protein n=1 Tax=Moraxella nasovis TaxID=2904121 RepID=UPI001F60AC9B|nr:methyltransferase domain-containing protein [Moraxella nasovis]UNU73825.1 methyltransferase domain-containing protein [Moraxella nasovis]